MTEPSIPSKPSDSLVPTMVRGVAWTALVKWGSQALSWAAVVVLARVLTKEDYGIVGMATLYIGLVAILTEGGLGTSILAIREMTKEEIGQFSTFSVVLGLLGGVLTAGAAMPLGQFFRSAELPLVMVALGANAILASFRVVPAAIMQRDLRFRALAAVEGIQAVVNTGTTLVLALLGWRYWALVLGSMAATLTASVMSHLLAPQPFRRPRLAVVGRYYGFTRDVLVGRLSWYFYSNSDFAVAGRALGSAALGAYTFAWSIVSVPIEKVSSLVTRVSGAIFAKLRDDAAETARVLVLLTEGLVVVTLPASVGMAVVAGDFVAAYLGPSWVEAAAPLRILCLYATFRAVVTMLPQVLTMRGDTRYMMWNALSKVVAMPIAFAIGSRWGATGIAIMWVVVYPWFVVPVYRRVFRTIGLSAGRYLTPLWPTVRGVLAMLAALLLVRRMLGTEGHVLTRLAIQVVVGVGVYLLTGILPQRQRLRRLVTTLRGSPSQPATVPSP
jgi:PST family polysaccharide transporter